MTHTNMPWMPEPNAGPEVIALFNKLNILGQLQDHQDLAYIIFTYPSHDHALHCEDDE
jgi:hypothetical protein